MDSFAISYLSQFSSTASSDHGRSARLWGEVSMGITSSVIGRIVFASSKPQFGFAFALRGIAYVPCMICLFSMKQQRVCEIPPSNINSIAADAATAISTIQNEENKNSIKEQSQSTVNGFFITSTAETRKDNAVLSPNCQDHLKLSTSYNGSNHSSKSRSANLFVINHHVDFFNAIFFFFLVFLNGLGQ
jgi:hypothetical protein